MNWRLVFTRQAQKDAKKLNSAGLRAKAEALLRILQADPFASPPPFEKLVGDLAGAYSRRINFQHRLVYGVLPAFRTVKVIRMWSHYEQLGELQKVVERRKDEIVLATGRTWTSTCTSIRSNIPRSIHS